MKDIHLPENKFIKVFVIFWGVILGLYFLPFIIGGFLIYFFYRHVPNHIIRNSVLVALALPTLFIGSAWVLGVSEGIANPTPAPKITPTPTILPSLTPTPSLLPTPTASPSATPKVTPTPTSKSIPTKKPYVAPTKVYVPATSTPVKSVQSVQIAPTVQSNPPANTSSGFTCNCAKTCSQMSSCAEAQYQLNVCGCSARDADHDGTACDSQCQ